MVDFGDPWYREVNFHPPIGSDKEVLLEAIKRNGFSLQYCSESERADRDIVLAAVRQNGAALESASRELKADKEIVLEAMMTSDLALGFACPALKSDKDFMLEVVRLDGWALKCASQRLRSDKDLAIRAVRQDGLALRFASEGLRADREVVLEAVTQHGFALKFASDQLKGDYDVVFQAVRRFGLAWTFASSELQNDQDLLLIAGRRKRKDDRVFCSGGDLEDALRQRKGRGAVACAIAARGDDAPVLSVRLARISPTECEAQTGQEGNQEGLPQSSASTKPRLQCDVSMLSGLSFQFQVMDCRCTDENGTTWPGPTLTYLARRLVEELPKHSEVKNVQRVFINFIVSDDSDAIAVSAWDWDRQLSDYLPKA
mmetsp:Transcript_68163/g.142426  ORF Transcript_68163/g.142426 Transcript_68163/m.142426 type:complete len:372 (-) Transcript_68163:206-1321(-)